MSSAVWCASSAARRMSGVRSRRRACTCSLLGRKPACLPSVRTVTSARHSGATRLRNSICTPSRPDGSGTTRPTRASARGHDVGDCARPRRRRHPSPQRRPPRTRRSIRGTVGGARPACRADGRRTPREPPAPSLGIGRPKPALTWQALNSLEVRQVAAIYEYTA